MVSKKRYLATLFFVPFFLFTIVKLAASEDTAGESQIEDGFGKLIVSFDTALLSIPPDSIKMRLIDEQGNASVHPRKGVDAEISFSSGKLVLIHKVPQGKYSLEFFTEEHEKGASLQTHAVTVERDKSQSVHSSLPKIAFGSDPISSPNKLSIAVSAAENLATSLEGTEIAENPEEEAAPDEQEAEEEPADEAANGEEGASGGVKCEGTNPDFCEMEIALAEEEIIYAAAPAEEEIIYTPMKRCDACGEVFCKADCPYWKKMHRKKDISQTERQKVYSDKHETSSASKPQASPQTPAAMRQTASNGRTIPFERNNKRRMVHH